MRITSAPPAMPEWQAEREKKNKFLHWLRLHGSLVVAKDGSPMAMAGFGNMKALSTRNDEPQRASRPFDKQRDGFVIGEGAGVVVFETEEHARRRGATIALAYAEWLLNGASSPLFRQLVDESGAVLLTGLAPVQSGGTAGASSGR